MGELSKLPNIGKTVEEQLIQVGINTPDELRTVGAKTAWLKIQEIDESLDSYLTGETTSCFCEI